MERITNMEVRFLGISIFRTDATSSVSTGSRIRTAVPPEKSRHVSVRDRVSSINVLKMINFRLEIMKLILETYNREKQSFGKELVKTRKIRGRN